MPFNVTIKNLGKLKNADIRIGKFTVFAGPNNTGKSFVSKALYSLFGAMNANHLAENFRDLFLRWNEISWRLRIPFLNDAEQSHQNDEHLADDDKASMMPLASLAKMDDAVRKLRKLVISVGSSVDEESAIQEVSSEIAESVRDFGEAFFEYKARAKKTFQSADDTPENHLNLGIYNEGVEMVESFERDALNISQKAPEDLVNEGLASEIERNLRKNFMLQQRSLSYLGADAESDIAFQIESIGNVKIGDVKVSNNDVVFDVSKLGLRHLQGYSRVLYLESPFFWRFKRHLEVLRMDDKFSFQRDAGEVEFPKYFYDMVDALRRSSKGTPAFSELFEQLTSKEVLGGKLSISDVDDELHFQEGDKSLPLHLSSVGVANLGMLALLMERNLLDENTFLFIDEPESNLHPAWQVEMAEALYALSKAGVNVVIATHSSDIMKWLEVHILKHKEDAESDDITLNHFRRDGIVQSNGESILDRIEAVQEELAGPYSDMFVDGM